MHWCSEVQNARSSATKQQRGPAKLFQKILERHRWGFSASWIARCKQFSNPLGISQVTASSLRGVPLYEPVHCPLVPTRVLEATQMGEKRGMKLWRHKPFCLFYSLSVCTLCHHSPWRDMASVVTVSANRAMVVLPSPCSLYITNDVMCWNKSRRFPVLFWNQIKCSLSRSMQCSDFWPTCPWDWQYLLAMLKKCCRAPLMPVHFAVPYTS